MKEELSKPVTLVLYNPAAPAKISVDASAYGLGAVLLQKSESTWKPVTFASHSMTETERRYAQIEKEALATTWACEKFSDFVLGKHIMIETDHKPLVPLLGAKELDRLPPSILRFRLRMDRFSYDIIHVPGKNLYTADALSRAPMSCQNSIDSSLSDSQDLTELYVNDTISHLPASNHQLEIYKKSSVRRCGIILIMNQFNHPYCACHSRVHQPPACQAHIKWKLLLLEISTSICSPRWALTAVHQQFLC